ncbi:hypothetical protein BSK59_16095 [Paenibacillus odorifer]|uniref:hypothetical protein n=1 Tax=Paenibacillus odorifer TaxID=189426 RepID=UPI00096D58FB|nr:hypothetical protein [Paenibacillus odorifer]OME54100.1 hypothetical protein BSK59_16095 [Paenibacillus odorifer]
MRRAYTTSELMDKLDIGQVAEMVEPLQDIIVKRTESGIIVMKDALSSEHNGLPMPLSSTVLRGIWVFPKLKITFGRAIALIREGRTVICEYEGRPPVSYDSLDDLIHIAEAVDGVWYLED